MEDRFELLGKLFQDYIGPGMVAGIVEGLKKEPFWNAMRKPFTDEDRKWFRTWRVPVESDDCPYVETSWSVL